MKGLTRIPALCKAILFSTPVLLAAESAAQGVESDLSTSRDCTENLLQVPDSALLTREEKVALHDKTLLQSLNSFDPCQSQASPANNGAAGGGGGTQGAEGSTGAQAAVESTPVDGIQGDIPTLQKPRDNHNMETTIVPDKANPISGSITDPNGKLPEDIPAVENDDIIAKQFRQAAMEETNPAAKAKLWNEYRRYKNLPTQDEPELDTRL